jgi:hypothetical protein
MALPRRNCSFHLDRLLRLMALVWRFDFVIRVLVDREFRADAAIERPVSVV